ncbi:heavy-metal-associated domain-containing protein [Draconibacterium halophilum]|uniref:Heavy-metal-associated domain-containing protein n=1 Tax=Draconibacterium halophilum TaxID=2706887 RepID=A0A6C0RA55_9BACT|nr:heavy metal-associated domain-containing protein [Draconibacterium halophilum]QIA06969.1 heavy-metal-associated domain-containing protein [Draconibacterium halophilum]
MKKLFYLFILLGFVACNSGTKKHTEVAQPEQIVESTIDIGGLHCDACVTSVEKGVNSLSGIESVKVTLADSTAIVTYNASAVSIDEIEKSIEKRGYTIKAVN